VRKRDISGLGEVLLKGTEFVRKRDAEGGGKGSFTFEWNLKESGLDANLLRGDTRDRQAEHFVFFPRTVIN